MTAVTRSYCAHTPQWQRFQTQLMAPSHQVAAASKQKQPNRAAEVHPYQRQYAHVYHQRYQQLAPLCWKAAQKFMTTAHGEETTDTPPPPQRVNRILELSEGQLSIVVGTLVKEAVPNDESKPLVADGKNECRENDCLYLEDDSGRVTLECANHHDKHLWPTGAVVAVLGTVGIDGTMQVTHIIPLAATEEGVVPMDVDGVTTVEDPRYLMVVSGLECGNPTVPPTARDMLLAFLQGRFSHPAARHVARVLVAGGWTSTKSDTTTTTTAKEALQDADGWLDQILAMGIPCDVLPGESDPTTANWPQRPLHRSLLPRSSRWTTTCHRTPNPYQAKYAATTTTAENDAVVVVATDGLNVRAQQAVTCIHKAADADNNNEDTWQAPTALQVMEQHLQLRHLCPVGPSHVPTMPHAEQDPMVLAAENVWPRLYVTGGHDAFATQMTPQGTRLVAVPSFGKTGTAVLVELSTLRVQLLKFVDETD